MLLAYSDSSNGFGDHFIEKRGFLLKKLVITVIINLLYVGETIIMVNRLEKRNELDMEKEIEGYYQTAVKFVDEKFPDERAGNRRITILAIMKMLVELQSIAIERAKLLK